MTGLQIGDTLTIAGNTKTFKGTVACVFRALEQPRVADIQKYYKLETEDIHFKAVSKPCRYDRLVLDKGDGDYIIVTLSPIFVSTNIILRSVNNEAYK